jgi:hypothetical protein
VKSSKRLAIIGGFAFEALNFNPDNCAFQK